MSKISNSIPPDLILLKRISFAADWRRTTIILRRVIHLHEQYFSLRKEKNEKKRSFFCLNFISVRHAACKIVRTVMHYLPKELEEAFKEPNTLCCYRCSSNGLVQRGKDARARGHSFVQQQKHRARERVARGGRLLSAPLWWWWMCLSRPPEAPWPDACTTTAATAAVPSLCRMHLHSRTKFHSM